MFAMFGPYLWFEWSPFTIGQACRIGLYLVYFFGGVFLGSFGLESTFLRHPGALSSRWWSLLLASLIAGLALVIAWVGVKVDLEGPWTRPDGWFLLGICIVTYSATLSFASLALFLRFVNNRHPWADSLSNNSYAIYIVHYPFVIWTQYLLLGWSMAAEIKAVVVFSISLAFSWAVGVLLRLIPGVKAVI
jgi:surface polysaccharide O-acyltransferase-like enzyme